MAEIDSHELLERWSPARFRAIRAAKNISLESVRLGLQRRGLKAPALSKLSLRINRDSGKPREADVPILLAMPEVLGCKLEHLLSPKTTDVQEG